MAMKYNPINGRWAWDPNHVSDTAAKPEKDEWTSSSDGNAEEDKSQDLYISGEDHGLEHLGHYTKLGLHPVHLGDLLDGRYKVIHKLGHSQGVVWLCSDTTQSSRYVAVKIVAADVDEETCVEANMSSLGLDGLSRIAFPYGKFNISGPNGTHLALVLPVLGPIIDEPLHIPKDVGLGARLRAICRQLVEVMAGMHSRDIAHGDFRPANILYKISGLDGYSESAVVSLLGVPEKVPIMSRATPDAIGHLDESVPRYLVRRVNWNSVVKSVAGRTLISDEPQVIDFGGAYNTNVPNLTRIIPHEYRDPVNLVDSSYIEMGKPADIWALGLTLMEIRTGQHPFTKSTINGRYSTSDDDLLAEMNLVLGKLPNDLWCEWPARNQYFSPDEVDKNGRPMVDADMLALMDKNRPYTGKSILEKLRWGMLFQNEQEAVVHQGPISELEARLFANLLEQILKYDPAKRLTAEQILKHEWFTARFAF